MNENTIKKKKKKKERNIFHKRGRMWQKNNNDLEENLFLWMYKMSIIFNIDRLSRCPRKNILRFELWTKVCNFVMFSETGGSTSQTAPQGETSNNGDKRKAGASDERVSYFVSSLCDFKLAVKSTCTLLL